MTVFSFALSGVQNPEQFTIVLLLKKAYELACNMSLGENVPQCMEIFKYGFLCRFQM